MPDGCAFITISPLSTSGAAYAQATMLKENIHHSSQIAGNVAVHATAVVGPNCYLHGNISIGPGAMLKGGITLIGDITIGGDAVLEPGVCIASPKSGQPLPDNTVRLGPQVHVGAGTILCSGISIGPHAWIEPGTVVSRNIPPHAVVGGNPAIIKGYRDNPSLSLPPATATINFGETPGVYNSLVQGVTIHRFERIRDLRGDLTVGEFERNLPFVPKRYFIVFDVPSTETRGEHAHKQCNQFLVCVSGSASIVVDDGMRRQEVLLDQPNIGVFIPAGIWGIQYKYSRDGVLLVFASEYYDPSDYIRNYDDFLRFRGIAQ